MAQENKSSTPSIWDRRVDSLLQILKKSKPDTNRVLLLYDLASDYQMELKHDDAKKHAADALTLSQQLNYKKGECLALYILGLAGKTGNIFPSRTDYANKITQIAKQTGFKSGEAMGLFVLCFYHYYETKNNSEALRYCLQAKEIFEATGDERNYMRALGMLAAFYRMQDNYRDALKIYAIEVPYWKDNGFTMYEASIYYRMAEMFDRLGGNYQQAIEYYKKAIQVWITKGFEEEVAMNYSFIGKIYMKLNEDSLAAVHLSNAMNILKKIKDTIYLAETIIILGELNRKQGNYQASLNQFYKSLELYKQIDTGDLGVALCYFNIGYTMKMQGDSLNSKGDFKTADNIYSKSLENYLVSLKGYKDLSVRSSVADVSIHIGEIQTKLRNYTEAGKYLNSGLQSALQYGEKETVSKSYLFLSQLDSATGNDGKAYQHFKLHMLYRDSLLNMESMKKAEAAKLQNEFENKEQEIKVLSAENKLKTTVAEKQSQQKKFAYAAIGVVLLLSGYAFYRYRRFSRNKSEQKTLRERLQISQDLHDNVGSTLSSISVFSKVAQVQGEQNNKEEMQEVLGRISETSNEMVSEMNDIVWAINPKNDSMERIIQRMESFARPMLATRNIIFNLNYEPAILTASLDMGKRKIFISSSKKQ